MAERQTWHAQRIDELYERLGTGPEGLSADSARERLAEHGPNALEAEGGVTPLAIVLKQLRSPLIYLLAGAALVSLLTSHYADAVVIAAVIVLNTVLGFVQEYRAEQALESLRKMTNPRAQVVRAGEEIQIDAAEVVPGDILVLETGDRVAADARIIRCDDLEIDESILTGESEPVTKQTEPVDEDTALGDRINMAFTSTSVTAGRARALVVATGMESQLGRIAGQVQTAGDDESPLQKRMARLGTVLGLAGLGFSGVIFLIGILTGYDLVEMVLFSVAVAVSAIPEGLPAVISVTLALGVQRMAKRRAVIRSLPAVETLGSTTVICSDKTGTITRNEMTVVRLSAGGREYTVSGDGYSVEGSVTPAGGETPVGSPQTADGPADAALSLLLFAGVLANNSRVATGGEESGRGAPTLEGSPTEKAILACSAKGLGGVESLRAVTERERVAEIPFSSAEKYMATLVAEAGGGTAAADSLLSGRTLYVKGAPERVLSFCSHALVDGERCELDERRRAELVERNEAMAADALRVIAAAVKPLADADRIEREDAEEGLTFVGMWGIIDPPREDAVEAIRDAQGAGIRVVMITGDHAVTASAIAHQVGIAPQGASAVPGPEIDGMSDQELVAAAFERGVFARVSPAHKLRILSALRDHGEVVAMTGDGVNDAPALKGADIGVAMGIAGTEVAKGASDMVLLDDNFATIVHAVEEGRGIFANLRRVIFFLLATNLGEIITLAAGLVLGLPLPLTAIMILWINLVTDGACTIPLGVEPRHRDVLKHPPRDPKEPVLTLELVVRLLILSVVMAAGTILLYLWELEVTTVEHARTIAFTALAAFQWFQAFNARSSRGSVFSVGLFSNRWVLVGIGAAILLQLFAVQTAPGQAIFGTVGLSLVDWLLITAVTASIWVVDELLKLARLYERIGRRKSVRPA